jgi:hypothetical protein
MNAPATYDAMSSALICRVDESHLGISVAEIHQSVERRNVVASSSKTLIPILVFVFS